MPPGWSQVFFPGPQEITCQCHSTSSLLETPTVTCARGQAEMNLWGPRGVEAGSALQQPYMRLGKTPKCRTVVDQGWLTPCHAGDLLSGFVGARKCSGYSGGGASWHGGAPASAVGAITLQNGSVTSRLMGGQSSRRSWAKAWLGRARLGWGQVVPGPVSSEGADDQVPSPGNVPWHCVMCQDRWSLRSSQSDCINMNLT